MRDKPLDDLLLLRVGQNCRFSIASDAPLQQLAELPGLPGVFLILRGVGEEGFEFGTFGGGEFFEGVGGEFFFGKCFVFTNIFLMSKFLWTFNNVFFISL